MDRRDPPSQRPPAQVSRHGLRKLESLTRGRRTPGDGSAFREACGELSSWLVAGREARGLSREQVAQTTRIQLRTIERIEEGRFDELPADVFVRGFLRGYARCVGLPEDEALARYSSCGFAPAPVASAQAQALLESMASLAPEGGRAVGAVGAPTVSPRTSATMAAVMPGPVGSAAALVEVETALARGGALSVPLAVGSLRDLPAIDVVIEDDDGAREAAPVGAAAPAEVEAAATAAKTEAAAEAAAEAATETAAPRKRRKQAERGEKSLGPAVRDARGRFVRRTGAIAAVDVAQLGLAVEAAAIDGGGPVVEATPSEPVLEASVAQDAISTTTASTATDAPASASDSGSFEVDTSEAPYTVETVEPAPIALAPWPSPSASGRFGRVTGSNLAIPPRTSAITVAPTLVIDDDDPEDAERAREERTRKDGDDLATRGWRSFIPPALLDQQRGRQGGLTLAVIILLIVATLTLSYLMRRPSSASGDGITAVPTAVTDTLA
jgi:hypothetical protein